MLLYKASLKRIWEKPLLKSVDFPHLKSDIENHT